VFNGFLLKQLPAVNVAPEQPIDELELYKVQRIQYTPLMLSNCFHIVIWYIVIQYWAALRVGCDGKDKRSFPYWSAIFCQLAVSGFDNKKNEWQNIHVQKKKIIWFPVVLRWNQKTKRADVLFVSATVAQ